MSKIIVFVPNLPELEELLRGLALLMQRTGLTQQELSKQLQTTQPHISRMLGRQRRMYSGFARQYQLLRNVIRVLIEETLAQRGLELSDDVSGLMVDDSRVDPVLPVEKDIGLKQIPTKQRR